MGLEICGLGKLIPTPIFTTNVSVLPLLGHLKNLKTQSSILLGKKLKYGNTKKANNSWSPSKELEGNYDSLSNSIRPVIVIKITLIYNHIILIPLQNGIFIAK